MPQSLPVQAVYPQLRQALVDHNRVILQAPPGAGKSTGVPLELLKLEAFEGKRILLLEPRRLAAKNVARRLAFALGEPLGKTVGYRMRLDTRVGPDTLIEVVTEGILTRLIQNDPELEDVACVIFDEFHERSLQADLGLALCLDIQENLREDLRLLLMSATLDTAGLAKVLDNPPVVTSEGRQFPVETLFVGRAGGPPEASLVANTVKRALSEHDGSLLVFLPGVGEIRRVQAMLEGQVDSHVMLTPLFGGLENQQQDLAIQPAPPGKRKVVLSTAIAETSLTIEGISVVVDMGLERCSVFSPRSGMSSLITRAASKTSAEQRAGRAGRLQAGVCYRLWTETEHQSRRPHSSAEILEADLCSLVLELAKWGVSDVNDLVWVDLPPASLVSQAMDLLQWLQALDEKGRLTAHGKAMSKLSVHPRLAHMMVCSQSYGSAFLACGIAAALEERAPRSVSANTDFLDRMKLLDALQLSGSDRGWAERVRKQGQQYLRRLDASANDDALNAAQLLALAFPDRIGQRRSKSGLDYRLSGGGSAAFHEHNSVSVSEFIVVPELDGRSRESRIYSAAAISFHELEIVLGEQFQSKYLVGWDNESEAVIAEKQLRLGALVLERKAENQLDQEAVSRELIRQVRKRGLSVFEDYDVVKHWQARVMLLRSVEGEASLFPDVSDQCLLETLEDWIIPWLDGIRRLSQLRKVSLKAALESLLDWSLQQRLNEEAPTHFQVPSGSRIALDYLSGDVPVLPVRIQEVFSSTQTPAIAKGRVTLVLHLLSPARRPIQITRDLVSFWANGYPEVKKELKGRYPKHHWPDDPLNTEPHRTVKPKR